MASFHLRGLGDEFLRHVERTRLLVHLVDAAPADGSDPVANYRSIRDELRLHAEELAAKPELVAANKMDLAGADEGCAALRAALSAEVWPVSATAGNGVPELIGRILELVRALREEPEQRPAAEL
jgi:GTP-binding protein